MKPVFSILAISNFACFVFLCCHSLVSQELANTHSKENITMIKAPTEFTTPMPERKPKVIYDAFFQFFTRDFHDLEDYYNLAPRGLHPGIKVIPLKPDSGGRCEAPWTGGDYSISFEKRKCDCCGSNNDDFLKPKRVSVVEIHGKDPKSVDCFLPSSIDIFVTEKLKQHLTKTSFTGYELLQVEDVDDTRYHPSEEEAKKAVPVLYLLIFKGTAEDKIFKKWFNNEYPAYCKKCGWGPSICPKCGSRFFDCPHCEENGNSDLEGHDFEYKKKWPKWVWEANQACFPFYGLDLYSYLEKEIRRGSYKVTCLAGEQWDGSDFLFGRYVSGRVAKWLVENQYGPALLVPYPLDISRCSKEQLEAIEKIRYKE